MARKACISTIRGAGFRPRSVNLRRRRADEMDEVATSGATPGAADRDARPKGVIHGRPAALRQHPPPDRRRWIAPATAFAAQERRMVPPFRPKRIGAKRPGPHGCRARSARFRGWPCYSRYSRYSAPRCGSRNGGKDRRLLRTACLSPSGVAGIAEIAGGTGWNRGTGDGARPEGGRSWHHHLPAVPAWLPLHLGPGWQPAPPAVALIPGALSPDRSRPFSDLRVRPIEVRFRGAADIRAGSKDRRLRAHSRRPRPVRAVPGSGHTSERTR